MRGPRVPGQEATIRTLSIPTAEEFRERAQKFLAERETENHLMLGILSNLLGKPVEARADHRLVVLEDQGEVLGAAVRTPPYPWVVTALPEEGLQAFAEGLVARDPGLRGASGPGSTAGPLARELASRLGGRAELQMAMALYRLEGMPGEPTAPGGPRPARMEELETLAQWCRAFNREAPLGVEFNERSFVEGHLRAGRLFVWEDEEAVSMAAFGGETPNGVRVYMVYTPPSRRHRGYAGSLTAALSRRLLEEGRRYCFLYTDLANPASNRIYRRIGYRYRGDWDVYRIDNVGAA